MTAKIIMLLGFALQALATSYKQCRAVTLNADNYVTTVITTSSPAAYGLSFTDGLNYITKDPILKTGIKPHSGVNIYVYGPLSTQVGTRYPTISPADGSAVVSVTPKSFWGGCSVQAAGQTVVETVPIPCTINMSCKSGSNNPRIATLAFNPDGTLTSAMQQGFVWVATKCEALTFQTSILPADIIAALTKVLGGTLDVAQIENMASEVVLSTSLDDIVLTELVKAGATCPSA